MQNTKIISSENKRKKIAETVIEDFQGFYN